MGLDDTNIEKAQTVPIAWRVPSDYEAVRHAQNTATPLAAGDSGVAQTLRKMARTTAGLSPLSEKKRRFSLFR